VKVVQQMLGHASATMTMDTYGHLFENRLDEVADALDRARAQSEVDEDLWKTTADEGEILWRVARRASNRPESLQVVTRFRRSTPV
jgi:hypothetical protein